MARPGTAIKGGKDSACGAVRVPERELTFVWSIQNELEKKTTHLIGS